jgi:hypothetical protein
MLLVGPYFFCATQSSTKQPVGDRLETEPLDSPSAYPDPAVYVPAAMRIRPSAAKLYKRMCNYIVLALTQAVTAVGGRSLVGDVREGGACMILNCNHNKHDL